MNKLREIFCDTEKYRKQIESFKRQMIEDHHCSYCIHSIQKPHYEMGKDAGTDNYCPIFNELKLNYDDGMQCIFWEENTLETEKFK